MNNTEKEAYGRMATYCSGTEHCRSEVLEKLKKWELDKEAEENILKKLEEENFLNEERFCQSFVHDKFHLNKWGKLKIAQGLYLKKIKSSDIWKYLNEIGQDEYLEVLQNILRSKKKNIKAKNDYELSVKLARYATSKGFEMKDIQKCLHIPDEDEM